MSEKSETPSEAEARKGLVRVWERAEFGDDFPAEAFDAYRAAVLRTAEAETVALVERLRDEWLRSSTVVEDAGDGHEVTGSRCDMCAACGEDHRPETIEHDDGCLVADADAWLAKRGGGQ